MSALTKTDKALITILSLSTVAFIGLSIAVLTQNLFLITIDARVALFFQSFVTPGGVSFFSYLTYTTGYISITAVSFLIALYLWRNNKRQEALAGVLLALLTSLTVTALKNFFAIARPDTAILYQSTYSFPSGHATAALTLALLLSYVAHITTPGHKWYILALGTSILALLIGVSRLYLQVHRASEVMGGYLLALIMSSLTLFLLRRFKHL